MLANLCVESHLRELLEQGFEVAVVKDATAGPQASRAGGRLQSGDHQLRLPGKRGLIDGRYREGDELGGSRARMSGVSGCTQETLLYLIAKNMLRRPVAPGNRQHTRARTARSGANGRFEMH